MPARAPQVHHIFVYGTLRRGFHNHELLGNARCLGAGWTQDAHTLRVQGIPYLCATPATHRVRGEVYVVEGRQAIQRLDRLERHPEWYQRRPITVVLDSGELAAAEAYFLNDAHLARYADIPVSPTGDYAVDVAPREPVAFGDPVWVPSHPVTRYHCAVVEAAKTAPTHAPVAGIYLGRANPNDLRAPEGLVSLTCCSARPVVPFASITPRERPAPPTLWLAGVPALDHPDVLAFAVATVRHDTTYMMSDDPTYYWPGAKRAQQIAAMRTALLAAGAISELEIMAVHNAAMQHKGYTFLTESTPYVPPNGQPSTTLIASGLMWYWKLPDGHYPMLAPDDMTRFRARIAETIAAEDVVARRARIAAMHAQGMTLPADLLAEIGQ